MHLPIWRLLRGDLCCARPGGRLSTGSDVLITACWLRCSLRWAVLYFMFTCLWSYPPCIIRDLCCSPPSEGVWCVHVLCGAWLRDAQCGVFSELFCLLLERGMLSTAINYLYPPAQACASRYLFRGSVTLNTVDTGDLNTINTGQLRRSGRDVHSLAGEGGLEKHGVDGCRLCVVLL